MRLVMMGTGPFAVPTFRGLFDTHHDVVALVTVPMRERSPKRPAMVTPMRDVAHEFGLPIFDPEDVNARESLARLRAFGADLWVVCDYGQILSSEALAAARLGGINLHASLLPRYRGAAPINWAIYHGEPTTGVTVIHMTAKVDAGPCIAQAHMPIEPDETAVELEQRLCNMGAWLMRRTIDQLEAGLLDALPQDAALASRAPRLKKSDGAIDWTRSATAIKNHVRAMEPWPQTYTFWHREAETPLRLILGPVAVLDAPANSAPPGTVTEARGHRLVIATGEGAVAPATIQPAGRRVLSVDEFLRGYHVRPGDQFGPDEAGNTSREPGIS
ncbi:MAG: methionyl-tRNA formyltransferase [Pirellulales bacterium]|nr:methionyl-tRNA formyltransferase [Pirellulales bacterium]